MLTFPASWARTMHERAPQIVAAIDKIPWPVWLAVGVIGFLGVIKLTLQGIGWA